MDLKGKLQQVLGDAYVVERELGGGGMATVFVAHERAFDRPVVVKVLPEHLAGGVNVDRFKREIMVAAGLQHPHIVGVLSAGEVDGHPFFLMPYVEGRSLRARLEPGSLPIREAVDILKDVARGLAHAHERGVVHRDVKPDNILLSGGAAALTDFGVAKAISSARGADDEPDAQLTQAGTSLGTPAYMAPEQAAGQPDVDHRADLYALGITAYEMLTGRPPFAGRPISRIIAAHIAETPSPPDRRDAPPALVALVMRCLEKEPAARPQSAADLLVALNRLDVFSGAGWTAPALRRQRVRMAGVGAVAVALAAFAGFWFARGRSAPADERSVAVLPFANVGGDTAEAYFADGMTDELIAALQRVPQLRVASRTAAFRFRGSDASVAEIGDALGVASVLEGTVRRGGNRLRVTAQLVSAQDGLALWSESYETGMRDVFDVQDSIARAIVASLRETFGGEPATVSTTRGTGDLEAYDLYLRGRFFFARRGDDALRRAIAFFRQAIARDSNYAAAYAGLADSYGLLPLYGGTPSDSVLPLALEAADRAIALDAGFAAAYAARANLLVAAWQWTEAERDFQRAIELDPEYATAHQWYGELLELIGRRDAAVAELQRATALDPLSPVMAGSYGTALAQAGAIEEAVAQGRRAVELGPSVVTYMMLGNQLGYAGQLAEAARQLERAVAADSVPAAPKGMLGYLYARLGRLDTARAVLRPLLERPDAPGHQVAIARIYLGLGQPDSTLMWLDRGIARHDPFFQSEGLGAPVWDSLRRDPRFRAVVERVGLDPSVLAR